MRFSPSALVLDGGAKFKVRAIPKDYLSSERGISNGKSEEHPSGDGFRGLRSLWQPRRDERRGAEQRSIRSEPL
eukprot:scaffold778_cov263-Pinguiococcus_pyrenoidosus.AAC.12